MKDKTVLFLVKILLLCCIVAITLFSIHTTAELAQTLYDLRYKETINSTLEYPYTYIYRKYDRTTGEVTIVIDGMTDDGIWKTGSPSKSKD